MNDCQKAFNIYPVFNTEAISIQKEVDHWVSKTNNGTFQSKYLVGATGSFGKPKPIRFKGMATFTGKILHSYGYKMGRNFKGRKVLIVGVTRQVKLPSIYTNRVPSMLWQSVCW